jgi:endonuclease V-like protein UPF0215 family
VPSHVIGIDDGPFDRAPRRRVAVVGTVYSGLRLDGVVSTRVGRDGTDATDAIAAMIAGSRFAPQVQVVMLQGIAVAGFNVIDVHALHETLGVAVLVVVRRRPDLAAIESALDRKVRGGAAKWRLIQRAGPMEPVHGVWVQRVAMSAEQAEQLVGRLAVHGKVPEPLRVAHLIAGGVVRGESRGAA